MCSTRYFLCARVRLLPSTSTSAKAMRSPISALDNVPVFSGGSKTVGSGSKAAFTACADLDLISTAGSIPRIRSNRWSRIRLVTLPVLPSYPKRPGKADLPSWGRDRLDRKSTRLNSSHSQISYAVFCLKKKKKKKEHISTHLTYNKKCTT